MIDLLKPLEAIRKSVLETQELAAQIQRNEFIVMSNNVPKVVDLDVVHVHEAISTMTMIRQVSPSAFQTANVEMICNNQKIFDAVKKYLSRYSLAASITLAELDCRPTLFMVGTRYYNFQQFAINQPGLAMVFNIPEE